MLGIAKALIAIPLGLAPVLLGAPAVADAPVPQTMTIGGRELVLNGYGTRTSYTYDLYTVALYLPQPMTSAERIDDPSIAKAFRVEAVYEGSMPDEVPEAWRSELLPPLSQQQVATLKDAFDTLESSDIVGVTFVPGSGTTVQLNDEVVLYDPGHDLMAAAIDLWLGPDPVSADIRSQLLAGGA